MRSRPGKARGYLSFSGSRIENRRFQPGSDSMRSNAMQEQGPLREEACSQGRRYHGYFFTLAW